jgi:hypothetical protein
MTPEGVFWGLKTFPAGLGWECSWILFLFQLSFVWNAAVFFGMGLWGGFVDVYDV